MNIEISSRSPADLGPCMEKKEKEVYENSTIAFFILDQISIFI